MSWHLLNVMALLAFHPSSSYRKILRAKSLFHFSPYMSNIGLKFIQPGATVEGIYSEAVKMLAAGNVPEPEDSARLIISHIIGDGYRMSDFYRSRKYQFNSTQLLTLNSYLRERIERKPVQYIIGNWDFCGFTINVRPPTLIPRPETEELVEKIIHSKILNNIKAPRILDIGTGSGVIGIALLNEFPKATCVGLDISSEAIQLANINSKMVLESKNSHRFETIHMSFLEYYNSIINLNYSESHKFDLIVSNPPYIPTEEMTSLQPEVKLYEDEVALHGGSDGLDIIREILLYAPNILRSNGSSEIWMEVSDGHPEMIQNILKSPSSTNMKCVFVEGMKDLCGKSRFVRLRGTA